ncbi:ATP phosphoribosyltransferase regulatory subunit [Pseudanabaena sp. PCC 6802]|uniref:ATP phosphoribosyltransferase regulatory subunit n=1 Tax=Pseudanabaena sp. PCC 6802 TaxID=118173 RepID=UPI000345CBB3|nr:ATP phosphoribosyltransferase regulatory subunit [Pseudanabaena sp. PCC 6802]
MVHQLPTGARDLLPLDVVQKRWIESRVQKVFQAWGYQRIITPTLERLETLVAGGAVQPEAVIQLLGNGTDVLGLRPELTASIARAYATRLGSDRSSCPQRLYYNANVFRQIPAGGYPGQQEYYQTGVELLGGAGLLADGEILLLLADCLQQVELPAWKIILGDAGLTSGLLNSFPEQYRDKIRHCLAHLDRITLENLPISDEARSRALELLDLRGAAPDVLSRLSSLTWIAESSDRSTEINHLKSLVELWQTHMPPDALIIDLSLIQTFDYYTGIVFEVVSDRRVVAQGGRYDRLLGIYHPQGVSFPSIGFCLNLEDLQKVLLHNLPTRGHTNTCLVAPSATNLVNATFSHAASLRQQFPQQAIEIELEFRSQQEVRDRARSRGIQQIAWVKGEDAIEMESLL